MYNFIPQGTKLNPDITEHRLHQEKLAKRRNTAARRKGRAKAKLTSGASRNGKRGKYLPTPGGGPGGRVSRKRTPQPFSDQALHWYVFGRVATPARLARWKRSGYKTPRLVVMDNTYAMRAVAWCRGWTHEELASHLSVPVGSLSPHLNGYEPNATLRGARRMCVVA